MEPADKDATKKNQVSHDVGRAGFYGPIPHRQGAARARSWWYRFDSRRRRARGLVPRGHRAGRHIRTAARGFFGRRRTDMAAREVTAEPQFMDVRYWPKADIVVCAAHVRVLGVKRTWPVGGIRAVAIGGKADVT